jgi:hypothetical protein
MNMPGRFRLSAKFKVILVLIFLNLLGFWAAQTYFSGQESTHSDKETLEQKSTLDTDVEEESLMNKDWGTILLSLFLSR